MAAQAVVLLLLLPAAPPAPALNVLNGSYFVDARKAAAVPGAASTVLLHAIAAINGSAMLHTPEGHVHDGPQWRNESATSIGPFSVMNKTITPPSGDKHDFICISAYYWPCNARCGPDESPPSGAPPPKGASCATFCKPPHALLPDGSCLYQAHPAAVPGLPHDSCPGSWCNNGSNIVSWNGRAHTGDCSCTTCNHTSGLPYASHNGFNWPGAEVDRGSIDGVWENVIPLVLGWRSRGRCLSANILLLLLLRSTIALPCLAVDRGTRVERAAAN